MSKKIIKIDLGDICMLSLPCRHYVTISYDDNTQEKKCMGAIKILDEYGKYLSVSDRNHFDYLDEYKKTGFIKIEYDKYLSDCDRNYLDENKKNYGKHKSQSLCSCCEIM